jgi:hypothetical protein
MSGVLGGLSGQALPKHAAASAAAALGPESDRPREAHFRRHLDFPPTPGFTSRFRFATGGTFIPRVEARFLRYSFWVANDSAPQCATRG